MGDIHKTLLSNEIQFLESNKTEFKVHFAWSSQPDKSPLSAYLNGTFKEWQEEQNGANFERKYILSLVYVDRNLWLFAGVYKSLDGKPEGDKYYYQTELTKTKSLYYRCINSTDGEKLLQVLSNGMQLSSSEIAEKIGWSKDKTIRTLNNLKSSGYIEVFGKGRGTKYSKR